jgi:MFS transporter, SP family, ERD6-like sugar transporter
LFFILFFNLQFVLGTVLPWRDIAAYNIIAPILAFCCICLVPESPYWLSSKGRVKEARESLAWLRGWVSININLSFITPRAGWIYFTISKCG